MDYGEPLRYYRTLPVGTRMLSRLWVPLLVLGSLASSATIREPWAYIVFGLLALGGAYGLIRRAQAGWFVELHDDHLVVNLVTRHRIAYIDIAAVDVYRWRHGELRRTVANLLIAFNNVFGGQLQPEGRRGEVDPNSVELRFERVLWTYAPFPPFVFPRRTWRIWVDDPSALLNELKMRLAPVDESIS